MLVRSTPHDARFSWGNLPPSMAGCLRPELGTIAHAVIAAIRTEVPAYARPLEGSFGHGFTLGVEHALRQFVDLIGDPASPQEHRWKIFWKLGRGELREGRSLDSLQAAYRVGARVAWRHYARIAKRAGFAPDVTSTLAEAVFTHINDMAAESVRGYAEAQASAAGGLQRLRQRLLELILADRPVSPVALADLAHRAQWPLPDTVACVALDPAGDDAGLELSSVAPTVLMSAVDPAPYLLVPGSDKEPLLRKALHGRLAVLGPTVRLPHARRSLRWARLAFDLVGRGVLPREPLVACEDHLGALLLLNDEHLARLLGDRTIATFASLTPAQRTRVETTLHAWLISSSRGAPEVATILGVHPQTARYRMHQITDLFGDRLNDPDFRFELEAALRARRLLGEPGAPPDP